MSKFQIYRQIDSRYTTEGEYTAAFGFVNGR